MHDNCNPSDCPVSARVDALKEEFNTYRSNSSRTHKDAGDAPHSPTLPSRNAITAAHTAQTAFSTRLSQRLPGLSPWFFCPSMSRARTTIQDAAVCLTNGRSYNDKTQSIGLLRGSLPSITLNVYTFPQAVQSFKSALRACS